MSISPQVKASSHLSWAFTVTDRCAQHFQPNTRPFGNQRVLTHSRAVSVYGMCGNAVCKALFGNTASKMASVVTHLIGKDIVHQFSDTEEKKNKASRWKHSSHPERVTVCT